MKTKPKLINVGCVFTFKDDDARLAHQDWKCWLFLQQMKDRQKRKITAAGKIVSDV